MGVEKADQTWECHECGKTSDKCTWIWLDNLCQHVVSLCPSCLRKLKLELGVKEMGLKQKVVEAIRTFLVFIERIFFAIRRRRGVK